MDLGYCWEMGQKVLADALKVGGRREMTPSF